MVSSCGETTVVAIVPCAVAVKVTGEPIRPVLVTVTDCAPGVMPSVHTARARPLTSEVVVWPEREPPPVATVQASATPPTGLPSESVTTTTSFCGNAAPAAPVCAFPLSAEITRAAPGPTVMLVVTADAYPVAANCSV